MRDAKTLFMIYTGMALVFGYLFFMNSSRASTAIALSQPLNNLEIVEGRVLDVRKENYIAILFPVVKHYVDFEFTHDGQPRSETFHCRNMSACHWLKTGPAQIIVTENGRHALPLDLRDNYQSYRKRTTFRRNMSLIMAGVMALMSIICGLSAGIIRPAFLPRTS